MESLSSGQLSGLQKDELMEQVKQQIAVANAQELLTVYPNWFCICGIRNSKGVCL
jgi:cation diffusion facilitator CzcD-associated flavoprotein CzcO